MKLLKIVLPMLILLSLSLMLAGCPKDKMMGDTGTPTRVQQIG